MAPVHNFNEAARYGIHYKVQYSLAYHSRGHTPTSNKNRNNNINRARTKGSNAFPWARRHPR
ncbi:hypothetical protein N7516_002634 [Penicillium verrucosum]|uniref:uncharacterized protein n=1 Tax=Penicillium verrucosum TaxID=60171 RepID=UPI0025456AC2|nr:uncharacterized protein N7516_002634 [Penicillium verrucosum]KAJ5942466.1 hypothetical protein N7516_002634 [Penicillium verrucosum]